MPHVRVLPDGRGILIGWLAREMRPAAQPQQDRGAQRGGGRQTPPVPDRSARQRVCPKLIHNLKVWRDGKSPEGAIASKPVQRVEFTKFIDFAEDQFSGGMFVVPLSGGCGHPPARTGRTSFLARLKKRTT